MLETISKIEKTGLLLLSSLAASYYLYAIFVALAAPESRARDLLPGSIFSELLLLGFISIIGKGVVKRRILAWSVFLILVMLLVSESFVSEQLFRV